MKKIIFAMTVLFAANAFAGEPILDRGRPVVGIMPGPELYSCLEVDSDSTRFGGDLTVRGTDDNSFEIRSNQGFGDVYKVETGERTAAGILITGTKYNTNIACAGSCGVTRFVLLLDADVEGGSVLKLTHRRHIEDIRDIGNGSQTFQVPLTCHQAKF